MGNVSVLWLTPWLAWLAPRLAWLTGLLIRHTYRVLSIMPNQLVRDQWEYLRKIEQHFLIRPGQPIGMAPTTFYLFPNSLIRAKNRFVKNGMAKFGGHILTKISGPPQ